MRSISATPRFDLFRRNRESHVALRYRRWIHASRRKPASCRERISATDSDKNELSPIRFVNCRQPERTVRQILRENHFAGFLLEPIQLRIVAGEQHQATGCKDESA